MNVLSNSRRSYFVGLMFVALIIVKVNVNAQTLVSIKDGEWEDSTTWNNSSLGDTVFCDSVIIQHHVTFTQDLFLENSYIKLDSGGSLCGHDTIHLLNSFLLQEGGCLYVDYLMIETSKWLAHSGCFQLIYGDILYGDSGWVKFNIDSAIFYGWVGGGFVCSNPVESWQYDTLVINPGDTDTVIISPTNMETSIQIYPNPFSQYFIVESEFILDDLTAVLSVYDLLGRKMTTYAILPGKTTLTIFTSEWPSGIYFLRIEAGEKIINATKMVLVK